jgi:hypothetical protein
MTKRLKVGAEVAETTVKRLCAAGFDALVKQWDKCINVGGVYKVVLESSRTVIVVTALVKEDERGGQGHTSASLLRQSAT